VKRRPSFVQKVLMKPGCAAEAAAAAAASGAPLPPLPFYLQPRGAIAVKGKGVMETHFLLRCGDVISPDELLGPSSPPRTFDSSTSNNSSFNRCGSSSNAIVCSIVDPD
jgi:hypothetical protein